MTDTTDLAVGPDRPAAADADIDVEIWGPPGSGKSALLASLYEALDHRSDVDGLTVSPDLREAQRRFSDDARAAGPQSLDGPRAEQLTVALHDDAAAGRRLRVVAQVAEELLATPAATWAAGRAGKVVIACFNPFLLDANLAWLGLRHLAALLQGPAVGLPMPRAVAEAASALLHVDAEAVLRRPRLRNLPQATLTYDAARPDPESRFDWGQTDPAVRQQLSDELRRLIQEQVRQAAPAVNVVRRGLRQLESAAVVLTHVDLVESLLPSITSADFERVFDDLFAGRPRRMAQQQILVRLFQVEVSTAHDAADGTDPAPPAVTGRLRPDGAAGVIRYLTSAPVGGADAPLRDAAAEARARDADVRAAEALAELDRERLARRELEATVGRLQAERDELAERARAEPVIPPTNGTAVKALEDRLAAALKDVADRDARLAKAPPPPPPPAESAAELDAARRRFEELRARTHEEISRRDESIQRLGEQVRAQEIQLAEERNLRKAAERGGLSESEAREREGYEATRMGPGRLWAALLLRSLPVVPACAAAAAAVTRATGGGTFGRAFVVASGVALVAVVVSLWAGVRLYWGDVGTRWVWFRSRNDKAGLFDVLTSTGERVQSPPREFTLEPSPLLELLGIGVIRRSATGLRYATTEPDAWRAHLDKEQVRRRWTADVVTVIVLLGWAGAVVWFLA